MPCRTDASRMAELERRRQEMVVRREKEVEEAKEEFLKKQEAKDEERRRAKLEGINQKQARMGIRPKGAGRRLGSAEPTDDTELYT